MKTKSPAIVTRLVALAMFSAFAAGASAQTPPSAGSTANAGGNAAAHRGPPAESIAACKSLALNQACSFTSPRGNETGTCWQPDASHPLGCRPAHKAPPPEALAACSGHKAGDSCAFTSPKGEKSGKCEQRDGQSALGCRPDKKQS